MVPVTAAPGFTVYGEHALKPTAAGVVEGVVNWVK
jgi:hypothetical protein